MPYVNHRWLGGLLTNWRTISDRIDRPGLVVGLLVGPVVGGLDGREEVELLGEEAVVVVQREPEECERLDEGASAELDLRTSGGDRVEGREALVHPDRVVGAEDRDAGAEPDPLGASGDRGQHDVGGGDREVGPVVLAEADVVHADPVGQHGLLDHLAEHLGRVDGGSAVLERDVAEGVETERGPRTGTEAGEVHAREPRPARWGPPRTTTDRERSATPPQAWCRGPRPQVRPATADAVGERRQCPCHVRTHVPFQIPPPAGRRAGHADHGQPGPGP
jgi:hypothetical protein